MKRILAAVAACTAASGAFAQSSLTVFGVVDAAITYTTGSGPVNTSKWQLTNSGNSFSRLGFRGTEDLGGGLGAGFWLEAGVQNDTGAGFPTNTNNQLSGLVGLGGGLTLNRRSTVSLISPWGELRLGRDYTPTFWNTALFDAFGTGGGIGANQIYFSSLGGLNAQIGTRASNSIGYFLPPGLGGFYGQAMIATGENASDAVLPGPVPLSTKTDGNYAGGRIGYTNGAFNIAIATGLATYATGDLRVTNFGVSYIFAQAMNLKLMTELYSESLGALDAEGVLLGLSLPIGAGEIKASYSRYQRDAALANLPRPTTSKVALGYVYNLSKRSALYATVARIANSNGAAQSLAGSTTSPNHDSTGTEFGMRHAF